jgi:CBS domain-containing protein
MLARELISDVVPALRTSDTGLQALSWMDIFRISHLPIVNNEEFLGLISDQDIYDLNMADEPIGNHKLSLFSPFVYHNQHIFDAIELISRLKLSVIPVLDDDKKYLGLITQNDLLHQVAELSALKNPGSIIELELNINDYSLSEIARIVEGNDARILGLYISSPEDSMKMNLIIKLNTSDVTSILQTFNRYNYNITGSFQQNDEMENLLHNRYELFMRYLSI